MIILDTNVMSELMNDAPAAQVVTWVKRQPQSEIYITAITKSEILFGLAIMPKGKKQAKLNSQFLELLDDIFTGHILPFDEIAAEEYARIAAKRRAKGLGHGRPDTQIAAIAAANAATIATRNIGDFSESGIFVVNPWTAP